jgi:hypothetical protein
MSHWNGTRLIGHLWVIFLLTAVTAVAQSPLVISYQAYCQDGDRPVMGVHDVHIAWYDRGYGGQPVHRETHRVTIEKGLINLSLGSVAGLPTALIHAGEAWIGMSIDDGVEFEPRTRLVTVPYAMIADTARVAGSLAPNVTGLVTSLNEIAGPVWITSDSTIAIRRTDNVLTFSSRTDTGICEQGSINGDGRRHRFEITPLTPITPSVRMHAVVLTSGDETIPCAVSNIDPARNSVTVTTAVTLQSTETLMWYLLSP